MFEGPDFPHSLQEETFNQWLEDGRSSKISYNFMLVVWDSYDSRYRPVYAKHRHEFEEYERYGEAKGREALIAVYDLYSEVRIN